MSLIIIWIGFTIFTSLSQELTQLNYFLYNSIMLCVTYFYNLIETKAISPNILGIIIIIPSILFWYIAYVYNDFLSITPIRYEIFVSLLLIYSYTLYFLFSLTKTYLLGRFKKYT